MQAQDQRSALVSPLLVITALGLVALGPACSDGGEQESGGDPGAVAEEATASAEEGVTGPVEEPPPLPTEPLPTYESPGTDRYGDLLPEGALQRLGSHRLRHGMQVGFLQFQGGADGAVLWTGASAPELRAWDLSDGAELSRIEAGAGAWVRAGIDAHGRLVAGSSGASVALFDLVRGEKVREHTELGMGLGVEPGGERMVLSALETGTAQVYGIEDAQPGQSFAARWRLTVSTWSPDRERIASLAHNRDKALHRAGTEHEPTAVVYLWDPNTGEAGPELVSQDDDIGVPVFSPDGGLVWCGDEHGRALAWDVLTGARVRSFGEGGGPPAFSIDVSPDGALVALGDQGGELRIYSATDGTEQLRRTVDKVGIQAVRFAPDSASVVVAAGLTLHAVSVEQGEEHPVLLRHGGPIKAAAWSADGKLVATGGTDRTVRIWDPVTGEQLSELEGHLGFVFAVRFSPDGKLLASAGQDGTVRFWDVETGEPEAVLIEGEMAVTDLDFSPDGTRLLAAVADHTLRVIDVETGEETGGVGGLAGILFQARYLGGGSRIASAARDVRVFDAASFTELSRIEGFDGSVSGFAASPDGSLLAGGLVTKEVFLWGADGATRHRLLGHLGRITAVAFAADGVLLATASETEVGARLWNAVEGRALGVLEGHRGPVLCLAFDPDGARLLTGSEDGTALVWATPER